MTDPEADPRFGKGFKKGFQIDPKPFKTQRKVEKQKRKKEKKQAKYGQDTSFRFSNRLVDDDYMHGKPLDDQFFQEAAEDEDPYRRHRRQKSIPKKKATTPAPKVSSDKPAPKV